MITEAFLICDAATDSNGKLNILGAFDLIVSKKLPGNHPQCAVAARLRFSREEQGQHVVLLSFFGPDTTEPFLQNKVGITIDYRGENSTATMNIIFNIHGLKLLAFGRYTITLSVDGNEIAQDFFYVRPSMKPSDHEID